MPESRTLGRLVAEHATNRGDAEALVFGDSRLTYAQLLNAVRRTAKGFLALGVQRGDRIAAWLPNSAEWVVVDLAAAAIGCVFVGLNTWYTAPELEHAMRDSGASVLVVTSRFRRHDYESEFARLRADATAGDGAVVGGLPALAHVVSFTDGFPGATTSMADLRAAGDGLDDDRWWAAIDAVQPEDPANLLYTSGSTARPKGVVLVHHGLIENGFSIGSRQHFRPDDRVWFGTPLFFSFGCANGLMATLSHGAALVLQDDLTPAAVVETMRTEKCTVYYASGNVTMALLDMPDLDASSLSLRTGLVSGSATVRAVVEKLGITEACNLYGLTETYGNCTVTDASEPLDVRATCNGTALPGNEIRIVDPDTGRVLGPEEEGEIQVRGYVTPGYYNDPERNAVTFTEDGFFKTSDLGFIDRAGQLHWISRLDDMIKTSGINVAPAEVEEVLDREPRIRRSYVVGLPDESRGAIVAAFIEFEDGQEMTLEEVREHCAGSLSSYKLPRLIEAISYDQVPFTPTGKVRKKSFRENFLARTAAGS
ncbi:AMP-binding protein [Pseudonocardia lacus]|uniref:AMP-binding protein n=1 Tax=Pseudonocardia lacus TaxID=2835865 RepID=UPI001BDCD8DF|nr:AMP-binding protein [Pseudonocardia lacus]